MAKKRKTNDRTYMIVSLAIVFISLVVGYAIFSETLNISGTAQTTGTFNVEFFSATPTVGATATPSGDKNTLTISVPNLAQPSATETVSVVIKNTGNVGAKLMSVDLTGNTDPDIEIILTPAFTTGISIAAGGTYAFDITVTWKSASINNTPKTLNFSATLNYQQDV